VLVRVWPRGEAQPGAPSQPVDIDLASGQLRLIGYDLGPHDWPGWPGLRLALYWRPVAPIAQRLKLSLRMLDRQGETLSAEDRYPLRLVAPTTAWLPGETVRDEYELAAPASAVQLLIIVYDEATVAEVGRITLPLP